MANLVTEGFTPTDDGTVTLSATTTTSSATLPTKGKVLLITNQDDVTSAEIAFVKLGGSGVVATANDIPVLCHSQLKLIRDPNVHTHVAVIMNSGTATVHVTTGE